MSNLYNSRRLAAAVALLVTVALVIIGLSAWPMQAEALAPESAPNAAQYILIGWNDLGMHCMNLLFGNLSVLPPFNTVWAQVVQRADPPKVVTAGVNVSYSIRNNTYSVGKTDFWTYAPQLFGTTLPDNIGLAGKGLAGSMDSAADHFVAVGIPLTPFLDNDLNTLYPYNLADLVATDSGGNTIATTTAVAPVSTEMHCEYCHADGKDPGGSTGNVYTNILAKHDADAGTTLMAQQPVLCAKCHADNALGAPGQPGIPNLSQAMHEQHTETTYAGPGSFPVCYNCHPGPQTQCLRDVMYQHGMTCTECHGSMAQVADPARNPWVTEPRCGTCHGARYAENAGKRYRDSVGHGGLYCEACHNSTHAIVPTIQYNDNIQNIALQGYAGTLNKCTTCHLTQPTGPGPHGLVVPKAPVLRIPANGARMRTYNPTLAWYAVGNATSYRVQLRRGSSDGQMVKSISVNTVSWRTVRLTGGGTTYFWRAQACVQSLCGNWSPYRSFKVILP